MSLEISDIRSIELDRSTPFHHCIRMKDASGHSLEIIKVNEVDGWAQFVHVYKAWSSHKDFKGKEK